MHFPRYWARGTHEGWSSWGYSDLSSEDASVHGAKRAEAALERMRFGAQASPEKQRDYGYTGVLREEVIESLTSDQEGVRAAITRNRLGCLVLNTTHAMFVDIDFPETKPAENAGFLKKLFGKAESTAAVDPQGEAIEKITSFSRDHSHLARVYQTKAGLRVLFVDSLFEPEGSNAKACFQALGADPLYVKLCHEQKSFRARLSPKPWRCGLSGRPPGSWPFQNENVRAAFQDWIRNYEATAADYATCRHLLDVGSGETHPELRQIVEVHDRHTKANSGLPLA